MVNAISSLELMPKNCNFAVKIYSNDSKRSNN